MGNKGHRGRPVQWRVLHSGRWLGQRVGRGPAWRWNAPDAEIRCQRQVPDEVDKENNDASRSASSGVVAVDFSGNSYYAFESRIEKYDAKGDLMGNYGQGALVNDKLEPSGASVSTRRDGSISQDGRCGSIRRFDADGKLAGKWSAENTEGQEKLPNGPIVVDAARNVYVSPWAGVSIWKLSSDGKPVAKFQIAAPREG